MEKQEEKQNNDSVDGKITTFASPAVLAAILDRESLNGDAVHDTMVDTNEREPDSEKVQDSLEFSLNDSLESTKLQEFGVAERVNATDEPGDPSEFTEQVLDFPKTSTPVQKANESNGITVEKAPRPRRPQHIIERNKENVGKRMPVKTSYARMHSTKAKNKLDDKLDEKSREKKKGEKSLSFTSGSDSGLENQSELLEEVTNDFDQVSTNSYEHARQTQNDLGYPVHERQEGDLLPDRFLNGAHSTYRKQHHGPYYDVSQTSNIHHNTYESVYSYQPTPYTRGYQSAMANLRQSHAMAGPILPGRYNPLSTQSAPPGGYAYHRKPLISNIREEDYYENLSSALPNTDFVNSDRRNKIPEPSLHRKFSSEPYLVQSSSPSLQKMGNVGRDSKASGSYSSLRQPFQYKPYTLKDYKNFAGANIEQLAGGLGPNVDTDQFKEKVQILITVQLCELGNLELN